MQATKVVAQCVSKKEQKNWDANFPVQTIIELEVSYDQRNIYHKLSGGTNLELMTVNQEAADMFVLDKNYEILIRPTEEDINIVA